MSTLVPFTPSTTSVFSFSPTLNGVQYDATVTYNVFGQRFYLNLTDLSGNLILCQAVTSSGPALVSAFIWDLNVVTVTTQAPHNIVIGQVANMTAYGTNTMFDGDWQMLATGPNTLTYPLMTNPQAPIPLNGAVQSELNMTAGLQIGGKLLFHFDSQEFEFE